MTITEAQLLSKRANALKARLYHEYLVLEVLVTEDRALRTHELLEIYGSSMLTFHGTAWNRLRRLLDAGLVYRPYHGRLGITERGRIAHALLSWRYRKEAVRARSSR